MLNALIILCGLTFLAGGWAFFYKPEWIMLVNKIVRERIFNDSHILMERRKKGVLLLLLSIIFFYGGYHRMEYSYSRFSEKLVSNDLLLYQALRHLQLRQYDNARTLCEHVLVRDPDNAEALYQLGAAQTLLGRPADGAKTWNRAMQLEPNYKMIKYLRGLVVKCGSSLPPASPTGSK